MFSALAILGSDQKNMAAIAQQLWSQRPSGPPKGVTNGNRWKLCRTVRVGFAVGAWIKIAPLAAKVRRDGRRNGIMTAEQHLKDPEVAIYKTNAQSEELERIEKYKEDLRERALESGASFTRPCCVDVQYSWACLERLEKALQLDSCSLVVGSVLLPAAVSQQELSLAKKCSPLVFQLASGNLIDADLAIKGSRKNFCRFVVAFACKKLSKMKAPFLVINSISSSSLGQILRTAYHFGVDSVILSEEAWECLDARAMRVSVGWGYHMDFHVPRCLPETLRELRQLGVCLYAEERGSEETDQEPRSFSRSNDWALLLGCEDLQDLDVNGINIRHHSDDSGTMDVAHSAAICLYELAVV